MTRDLTRHNCHTLKIYQVFMRPLQKAHKMYLQLGGLLSACFISEFHVGL